MSHSYEHTVQFIQIVVGAKIYYAESLEKLISNMGIAKPTIMTAVPRFYQNLFTKINMNFEKQKGVRKKIINITLSLGKKDLINLSFTSFTPNKSSGLIPDISIIFSCNVSFLIQLSKVIQSKVKI